VTSGVTASAGSIDLVSVSASSLLVFYIATGNIFYNDMLTSSWATPNTTSLAASALSVGVDKNSTLHMLRVDGVQAKHTTKGKSASAWSPSVQVKVEQAPSTYHPTLTPGNVWVSGGAPTFGIVSGKKSTATYASPFDVGPNSSRTGFEFRFPKIYSNNTYSGCRAAAGAGTRYAACATTGTPKGWWILQAKGKPPQDTQATTNISTSTLTSAPALAVDSNNKLHLAYADKVSSLATGGTLQYATWSGTGPVTVSTPSYTTTPAPIVPGSLDIAVNGTGTKVYITAQTVGTPGELLLITGPGTWSKKTISKKGGAESRVVLSGGKLHFAHVDNKGYLLYSCTTAP